MSLQPTVRILLTFLVAALSTVLATVDDETIRLICAPLVAGLAAIGIVPPQIPTRTVVDTENQRVNVVSDDAGQSIVEVLVVLTLIGVVLLLAGVRF